MAQEVPGRREGERKRGCASKRCWPRRERHASRDRTHCCERRANRAVDDGHVVLCIVFFIRIIAVVGLPQIVFEQLKGAHSCKMAGTHSSLPNQC